MNVQRVRRTRRLFRVGSPYEAAAVPFLMILE